MLENSAGGGDTLGSRIEELAAILDAVGGSADRLAFCLDTAHLWGAGYDISTPDGAAAVLDRFDALIGLDRLPLMHLNDSKSALGSRSDRHEHIGAGRIGAAGLAAFLRDPTAARADGAGDGDAGRGRGLRRGQHAKELAAARWSRNAARRCRRRRCAYTRRSTRVASSGESSGETAGRAVRRRG